MDQEEKIEIENEEKTENLTTSLTPKELNCSLCQDTFRNPKTLPCLHSYCLECLESLISRNHSNTQLSCPICRTPLQLQSEELPTLPTDLFLSSALDEYSANAFNFQGDQHKCLDGENEAVSYCLDCGVNFCETCESSHKNVKISKNHKLIPIEELKDKNQSYSSLKLICADGKNDATSYCANCETYFCELCVGSHKKLRMSKNHRVISISEMKEEEQAHLIAKSNPQNYCQTHQRNKLELFCENCKLPICSTCIDQHTSHKIQTIVNIIDNEKKPILDLIEKVDFNSYSLLQKKNE